MYSTCLEKKTIMYIFVWYYIYTRGLNLVPTRSLHTIMAYLISCGVYLKTGGRWLT